MTEKTPFRENPYREIINKENLEEENKEISTSSYQDNSKFRLIGNWEEKKNKSNNTNNQINR